jgi:choline-sulfatase
VVPTILEPSGGNEPTNIQGRSLVPLLSGATDRHRDHVVAGYADNAEVMVRTLRWKLVYSASNRRRRDGYALAPFPQGRSIRLYDTGDDPGEFRDVAGRSRNAAVVGESLGLLADHMRNTARDPDQVLRTGDVHALLASYLPPAQPERLHG